MKLCMLFMACAAAEIQKDASIASSVAQSLGNRLQSFASSQGMVSAYFAVRGFEPVINAVKQLHSDLGNDSSNHQALGRRDSAGDVESLANAEVALANMLGNLADKANDFISLNLGTEIKNKVAQLYPEIQGIAEYAYATTDCSDGMSLASGISALDSSMSRAAVTYGGSASSVTAKASCDASTSSTPATSTSSTIGSTSVATPSSSDTSSFAITTSQIDTSSSTSSAPESSTAVTSSTQPVISSSETTTLGYNSTKTTESGVISTDSLSANTTTFTTTPASVGPSNTTIMTTTPATFTPGDTVSFTVANTLHANATGTTSESSSESPGVDKTSVLPGSSTSVKSSTSVVTSLTSWSTPQTSSARPTSKPVFTTVRCRVRPTGTERPRVSSVIIS